MYSSVVKLEEGMPERLAVSLEVAATVLSAWNRIEKEDCIRFRKMFF